MASPAAAAPPPVPFRVRYAGFRGGEPQLVRLVPGMSCADVKEAVASALGLEPGPMYMRGEGGVQGFHAGLTGDDWEIFLLRTRPGVRARTGAVARQFDRVDDLPTVLFDKAVQYVYSAARSLFCVAAALDAGGSASGGVASQAEGPGASREPPFGAAAAGAGAGLKRE